LGFVEALGRLVEKLKKRGRHGFTFGENSNEITMSAITIKSQSTTYVSKTSDPDADYWELDVEGDGGVCLWQVKLLEKGDARSIITQDREQLEALRDLLNKVVGESK